MKALAISPYHLFQVRGDRFVYDIESGIAIRIDAPAYDALALRQEGAGLASNARWSGRTPQNEPG